MEKSINTTAESSWFESLIPDAMLLNVASYLEGDELLRFELISKKFHGLKESLAKETWHDVCHRRWRNWPRYRWENLRKSQFRLTTKTWKQRYLWVEADYLRTRITAEDLETSHWYFNFTPDAGGRGSDTLLRCYFIGGFMILERYPSMLYRLVDDGQQQMLVISTFPPHTVERLASNGEWIIKNHNVTFVSSHVTDTLTYSDRGFQG